MWRKPEPKHLFALGQVAITPAAQEWLSKCHQTPATLLEWHVTGNWGDVSPNDAVLNDEGVENGERIHSVYRFCGQEVWVITEWDRSVTTILLPEDY